MRLRTWSRSKRAASAERAGDDSAVLLSWAVDSAVAPPRVGLLTRFFLWCAGVDRDILVTRAEVYRYANLGLLVIAIATLGATTFTVFASVVLGRFHVVLLPFALGWGTLILLLDRAIVTEPHYRERKARKALDAIAATADDPAAQADTPAAPNGSSPNGSSHNGSAHNGSAPSGEPAIPVAKMDVPSNWSSTHVRLLVYLARVLIAGCLAFLVADAIMLLIFNPEVESELSVLHAAEYSQAVTHFAATQQPVASELGKQLGDDTTQRNLTHTQVLQDRTTLADEGKGVAGNGLTGVVGYGPQYTQDRTDLNTDTTAYNKLVAKVNSDTANVANEKTFIAELNAQDPAALANPAAASLVAQRKTTYADGGFDEREKAFSDFLKTDNGDVVATFGPWALRVLLISFDLLPLGAKLLNPYTIYGRRMSERALMIRYYDLARQRAMMRDAGRQAAVGEVRSRHDYEVEARRAAYRLSWQMNHMNDQH
jgi:hypothetical protein